MKIFLYTLILVSATLVKVHAGPDRDEEIRNEMWVSPDKSFKIVDVPEKWKDKSAVIIAQLNGFEYRKPVMRNLLRYNEYSHYRIKLIDKNAVSEYSEISFLSSRVNSGEGESIKVYAGFKVVKPGGKEVIIDPAKAVKMEREYRGRVQSYNKLAIPNLEPGDILDYYIYEETTRPANILHFFDPVIFTLPQEYPVMSHRLQFRAERKCYINLRSMNGAPELKLVIDEANDEKFYSLDGTDMEGVENVRWIFPYRELPTIKFRAAYASGAAMRNYDVLLGEPGEVKNSVAKEEVQDMVAQMMSQVSYDTQPLFKDARKNLKGVEDPFELATRMYYSYRNQDFNRNEARAVQGDSPWSTKNEITFVNSFTELLKWKDIPHQIIVGVSRNINGLNDLLIENELEWLVKVDKGNQAMYFSAFDMVTLPGVISPLLEGTDAYALDGFKYDKRGNMKTVKLPVSASKDNATHTHIKVDLTDLTKAKLSLKRTHTGNNKTPDQYIFADPIDFRAEELKNFPMEESSDIYLGKKKYQAMKEAYLDKRIRNREEGLKSSFERDFNLDIKEVSDFKIEETGRYLTAPAFVYSCTFTSDNLVNKAGANYIIDAGKLIEQQAKVETSEVNRKNNVYYEYPRSYRFLIEIDIPKGYEPQGLEKFNQKVENKNGGFTSTAKEVNGKVVIETIKHYEVNYVPASEWKTIVDFLNAASSFNEQKILLRKK